jgi:hypothetical protein
MLSGMQRCVNVASTLRQRCVNAETTASAESPGDGPRPDCKTEQLWQSGFATSADKINCQLAIQWAMKRSLKLQRAVRVARQRRDNSPDMFHHVIQSALQQIPGITAYRWRKKWAVRGDPFLRIVVHLGHGYNTEAAIAAAVDTLVREIDLVEDMQIFVTACYCAFWALAFPDDN